MSQTTPPSQMIRVPTPLVDAVRELSRLHREGYTHAVISGLQQLIATVEARAWVAHVDGKSDTELIAELIARMEQVENHLAPIHERVTALELALASAAKEPNEVESHEPILEDHALHSAHDRQAPIEPDSQRSSALEPIEDTETNTSPAPEKKKDLLPHTQTQLAIRWGMINRQTGKPDSSQISKKKTLPDFPFWSRSKDPEKIGWKYQVKKELFYPCTDLI